MATTVLQSAAIAQSIPGRVKGISGFPIGKYLSIMAGLFVLANGIFLGTPKVLEVIFRGRMMPLVTIGEHKVGGKKVQEVRQLFQSQSVLDQLRVVRYDSYIKTLRLADLGVMENIDQTIRKAYQIGRSRSWLSERSIDQVYFIDVAKMQSTITSAFDELIKPPSDAQITIQDGQVVITPSISGSEVDWQLLMERVWQVVYTNQAIIDLPLESTSPAVTTADLENAKVQAESWLNRSITLMIDGRAILVPPKLIGGWIEFVNENHQIIAKLDQEKIKEYIASLAVKYNQKMKQTITYEDGEVAREGIAGRELDQGKLLAAIVEELNETRQSPILVVFKEVPISQKVQRRGYMAGRDPGKYIEVNLTEQKMYTFEGDILLASYPVSTGKWSMPTPEGEFAINNKVPLAYSSRYKLYMPNWMAFIGSKYGIHGLPYRGDWVEGENHLGKPVSHGCIRLNWTDAETVYNWAEIGTKIFIHK